MRASMLETVEIMTATAEALFAEIVDHPDDDQRRLVYADFLQERGDPRGELIALQLANRGAQRVADLIATHVHVWLGPVAVVAALDRCKFERGFLAEVTLLDGVYAHRLGPAVGHPTWATVRRLHLGRRDSPPAALLLHPVMRALEDVSITARGEFRQVGIRDVGDSYYFVLYGVGARRQGYRSTPCFGPRRCN